MKIEIVKIKNFRSIKEIELTNLNSLVFFVGRNNAGKSNILKAINAFFENKISDSDYPKDKIDEIPEITVVFNQIYDRLRQLLTLDVSVRQITIKKVFDSARTPKIYIEGKEIAEYKPEGKGIKEFREIFHTSLPLFYYIPALRSLKNEETWKNNSLIKSLLEPLIRETSVTENSVDFYLLEIKKLIENESKVMKERINEFLQDKLDDFKELDIDIADVNIALATQIVITNSLGQVIQASDQGAGTQNFIILALAQYYAYSKANRPLIIAFEEPEISLHPQGQRKILQAIEELLQKSSSSSSVQILLTTHSSVMINDKIGKIILVRKKDGLTEVHPFEEKYREIVDELGITGSDIFQSDALVVVEGRSDYVILNIWAKKYQELRPNSPWKDLRITFFHLDGTFGIKEYRTDDFKNLALCSNLFAIMDSDKENATAELPNNIVGTMNKITKAGGKPFVLKYRTIESYFDPESIKSALGLTHLEPFSPYDKVKEILIDAYKEEFGKDYRAPREGRKIAHKMVESNNIPEEIIHIFDQIGEETAKRVGIVQE